MRTNVVNSCLPKEVDAKIIAAGFPTDPSKVPDAIYDVCTPSEGSNEVVKVKKGECSDERGTWVALDVVGAYSTVTTVFSIDQLSLWVYAVDGEYIEPQLVNAITVSNGERYSFLVHLTNPGLYTIRHASNLVVQTISGQATLAYGQATNQTTTPYIDDSGHNTTADVVFYNLKAQKAYPPYPVSQEVDQTFILNMGNTNAAWKWSMNGTEEPLSLDDATPILFNPQPNLTNNLTITTLLDQWIDLIFVAVRFPQPPHPIHKHNNKMWLIGSGQGLFKWSSVAEAVKEVPQSFNLVDPPRRDGFSTVDAPRYSTWTAVRYHVTDPGAWMLHCHIQTHLIGGMAMVIQDGIDHWPKVPPKYLNYGA